MAEQVLPIAKTIHNTHFECNAAVNLNMLIIAIWVTHRSYQKIFLKNFVVFRSGLQEYKVDGVLEHFVLKYK